MKRLQQKGLKVKFDRSLLEYLLAVGYDPQFGARPLKRLIEKEVVDELAKVFLKGDIDTDKELRVKVKNKKITVE